MGPKGKVKIGQVRRFGTPCMKIGQDEMPFEDYLIMEGEDIIEVDYCMSKLVDMALAQRIVPPSF